jgi:hypothetical protein
MLRTFAVAVLLVAMCLLASCSGDKSTDTDDNTWIDPRPSDDVLLILARAYAEKDIEHYAGCLHEDFLFVFTPDVADSLDLPQEEPWWGKTADVASTRAMFEDPDVTDITFAFEYASDWEPCSEVRVDSTYLGLCCRIDPLIQVTTVVEGDDPILKLRVDNSWLDVTVVPDPDPEGLWHLLKVEEKSKRGLNARLGCAAAATEPSSWGIIKARWASD